ncbi:3-deoxy-7-phosphoheptulonate synthase [Streptomyces sp. NPDC090445]|uniref:3-deoxy-7-phosphoheptulonate synthase n=1 Tax=Streptomyces sp. NPDC090445 TaxID=3365963 RepID=UPI0037FFA9B3
MTPAPAPAGAAGWASARTAPQQPDWPDPAQTRRVRAALAARHPLVSPDDLGALHTLLAEVAAGRALVVQAGDCAENPAECTPAHLARKAAVLELLAGALHMGAQKPVLRVGRIAGQFAKPRSSPVEHIGDRELPSYRGHLVNAPDPDPESRRPDPLRILTGYLAARDAMEYLGWLGRRTGPAFGPPLWTSHEALLLDYEVPLLRRDDPGRLYLSSTHWPWIGNRTNHADGHHVALLASVTNPVACKVGPDTTPERLLGLCRRLDPRRRPGRLTLIARMGADRVAGLLPPLVKAVRAAGHPVTWLTDPMHGNTLTAPDGNKTRIVESVRLEVVRFREAVESAGGTAGGLHLETTPDEVTECATTRSDLGRVGEAYTSLCDPRLTPEQALSVVSAWHG